MAMLQPVFNVSSTSSRPDLGPSAENISSSIPGSLPPAYAVLEVMVAVASIAENLLVLLVFLRAPSLRTSTNYYVISLSVADLLVGLIGIPSALANYVGLPRDMHACLIMTSLLMTLCTASIFSLVAVTMDRYWAIMDPLHYPAKATTRRALFLILVSWVLAGVFGLLPSMGWNKGRPREPSCFFLEVMDYSYLVFLFCATILMPSIFMAVVYAIIYHQIRRQVQQLNLQIQLSVSLQESESHIQLQGAVDGRRRMRRTLLTASRGARGVGVIVALFMLSWMPLYTFNVVLYFCPRCSYPDILMDSFIILSHLNSAWNPLLYAWGMRDFRYALYRKLGISGKVNKNVYGTGV